MSLYNICAASPVCFFFTIFLIESDHLRALEGSGSVLEASNCHIRSLLKPIKPISALGVHVVCAACARSFPMEKAHLGGGIALDLAEMWSYGDVDLNLKAKNQEEKQ